MKYRPQTYKEYGVIDSVRLNNYLKYISFLSDTIGDTEQNHWTMKYRLQ